MKRLFVSIAAFILLALPAFAQSMFPTPEQLKAMVENALKQGVTLEQIGITAPAPPPLVMPATAPFPAPAAASAPSITYLPKWYGSVGGGGIVPGHGGKFAYESISAYIGAQTYATTAQEFTLSNGKIQSCTMAGASKILYQFGLVSIGITGLGGGCDSTSGSGGAAAAAQGFASFHIGKSGFSAVLTGDKTFTTDGRQAAKITLGVSYGK